MKRISRSRLGTPIYYQRRCASTMDVARARAEKGAVGGTAVVARVQYAGRGQHNRTWETKRGDGLALSMVFRAPAARTLQTLSLRVACAVCRLLCERIGIAAQIRWPNDILVAEKKICGILSEYRSDIAVVGVGLNCLQRRFSSAYNATATSLYLSGYLPRRANASKGFGARAIRQREISPRALTLPLVDAILHAYYHNTDWHTYLNAHLWGARKVISVRGTGTSPFCATLLGVDGDGALLYRVDSSAHDTAAHTRADGSTERLYVGSLRACMDECAPIAHKESQR